MAVWAHGTARLPNDSSPIAIGACTYSLLHRFGRSEALSYAVVTILCSGARSRTLSLISCWKFAFGGTYIDNPCADVEGVSMRLKTSSIIFCRSDVLACFAAWHNSQNSLVWQIACCITSVFVGNYLWQPRVFSASPKTTILVIACMAVGFGSVPSRSPNWGCTKTYLQSYPLKNQKQRKSISPSLGCERFLGTTSGSPLIC